MSKSLVAVAGGKSSACQLPRELCFVLGCFCLPPQCQHCGIGDRGFLGSFREGLVDLGGLVGESDGLRLPCQEELGFRMAETDFLEQRPLC